MRVLITGAEGQLGRDLRLLLPAADARGVPTEVEAPESSSARTGRPFSFTVRKILSAALSTIGVSLYAEAQ